MKKVLLFSILLLWAGSSWAQLSNYAFSSSTGTYSPITGGAVLGDIASDDQRFVDPAVPLGGTTATGIGFPIGFNFTFDGVTYDRFAVNNNGWISLGQSALNPTAVNIISTYTPISATTAVSPAQLVSRIAGSARDLAAQAGAELRIQTIGTSPNQECVIQWKGYKRFGSTGTGDNYNFQIRMVETSNQVKIVYGVMTNNATATTVQVGLRGAPASPASNYANRLTTTDWTATTPGAAAAATCTLSNTIYPASGLTFTYSVPAVLNPATFNATAVSTSQINLAFTPYSGNNVVIVWDLDNTFSAPAGAPPAVNQPFAGGTLLYNGLVSPQNHTGLNAGTIYYYKAFSYTGSVYSTGVSAFAATLCLDNSAYPYTESFDGTFYPPLCWDTSLTVIGTGSGTYGNWNRVTVGTGPTCNPHSGAGMARFESFNFKSGTKAILVSPSLNLPTDYYLVKFWMYRDYTYPSNADLVNVYYNTSPTTSGAVLLGTVNRSYVLPPVAPLQNAWYQYEFGLPAGSGGGGGRYVILEGVSTWGGNIFVDDFEIVAPSSLSGYVYDFDGNPVPGATIQRVGGISTLSDASGHYTLLPLSGGNQSFKCFKPGYNEVLETIDIPFYSEANYNFTLLQPQMAVAPGSLFAILGTAETANLNLEITNNGNGLLGWNAAISTPASCEYTIKLLDGYGDGWDVASLDVLVNGSIVLDDITLPNGYGPVYYTFNVAANGEITVVYTAGEYPGENMYYIYNNNMEQEWFATGNSPSINILPGQLYGCPVDWITMDSYSGQVDPSGGTQTVTVALDAASTPALEVRAPGETYTADILFTSPSGIESVTVPVTLVVTDGGLKGPQELAMYIVNEPEGKFMLKWKYFTIRELQFEHFVVLRNGEILGTTINSFFDEVLTEPGSYCYKVYAVYNNGAYSEPSNEVCMAYPLAPGVPVSNWALLLGALLIGTYAVFMIRRRT